MWLYSNISFYAQLKARVSSEKLKKLKKNSVLRREMLLFQSHRKQVCSRKTNFDEYMKVDQYNLNDTNNPVRLLKTCINHSCFSYSLQKVVRDQGWLKIHPRSTIFSRITSINCCPFYSILHTLRKSSLLWPFSFISHSLFLHISTVNFFNNCMFKYWIIRILVATLELNTCVSFNPKK